MIEPLVRIACGAAHCDNKWGPWPVRGKTDLSRIITQAQYRGWLIRNMDIGQNAQDLCPEHKRQANDWKGRRRGVHRR